MDQQKLKQELIRHRDNLEEYLTEYNREPSAELSEIIRALQMKILELEYLLG